MSIIIKQLTDEQKQEYGIPASAENINGWSVWECEPSSFDWHYPDLEMAYVYSGHVIVTTEDEKYDIKAGDYVTFPKGLQCHWEVKERISKVYKFE